MLRFGGFEIVVADRRVLRHGQELPLRARSFHLLLALVRHAGHLVTKNELVDTVCAGLVVEETWARTHAPELAVRLTLYGATLATFSAWRPESAAWLASCESLLTYDLSADLRTAWWLCYATQLLFAASTRALEVARHAVLVFRELADPWNEVWSLSALARNKTAPDLELAATTDAIEVLLAAHPTWPVNCRLVPGGLRYAAVPGCDDGVGRR